MATPIQPTPILSGEDARRFLDRLNEPPPKSDTVPLPDFAALREKAAKSADNGKK